MPAPTRRAVLGGVAGVVALGAGAAGCTADRPPAPEPVDPDDALRAAAVAREQALLAAYDTVLAAGGDPGLRALRDEHAVHLAALSDPGPSPAPSSAPAPPTGALPDLRALERQAAAGHTADVARASRPLAALLAQLAASEAAHLVAL